MISVSDYFEKPHSDKQTADAEELLSRVNSVIDEAVELALFERLTDPDTGSEISGSRGGDGDGGFRTPGSTTGAAGSSHKQAKAVDVYDPTNKLDTYLDGFEGSNGENSKLEQYDLYRESATATIGWCHLQTRAPASGRRTYNP